MATPSYEELRQQLEKLKVDAQTDYEELMLVIERRNNRITKLEAQLNQKESRIRELEDLLRHSQFATFGVTTHNYNFSYVPGCRFPRNVTVFTATNVPATKQIPGRQASRKLHLKPPLYRTSCPYMAKKGRCQRSSCKFFHKDQEDLFGATRADLPANREDAELRDLANAINEAQEIAEEVAGNK